MKEHNNVLKEAYSIEDVIKATGLGRTKIYQIIGSGDLKARKVGKRTIILKGDLAYFLDNLNAYPTETRRG